MQYSPKKFHIDYTVTYQVATKNNHLLVWLAEPISNLNQNIERVSVSPEPTQRYTDTQGNLVLFFDFRNQRKTTIKMDITATLFKFKTDLIKKSNPALTNDSLDRFLINEKYLKQTKELIQLAHQLISGKKNALDKLAVIYNYCSNNFSYCYPVKKRGSENLQISNLRGDCGEFGALFVTLCRIAGIPAKNETGFVIAKNKTIFEHGWTSVFVNPFGWVNMDSCFCKDSPQKNAFQKNFGNWNEYKIAFSNGFNIPLKPKILKDFDLGFWNKQGLPMSNNSVQMLQPGVFASNVTIRFKDKIEVK